MNNPKVSIICPIHNTAKYLRQSLNSFCNQTLKDIEILLINDDSTDDSQLILEEYAKTDDRIKLFYRQHEENETWGYTNAILLALEHAIGEYTIIPDSDDELMLDALENLYNASNNKIDVVKGSMVFEDINKEISFLTCYNTPIPISHWDNLNTQELLLHLCPSVPELQTFLIRTDFLKSIPLCNIIYMDSGTAFKIKVLASNFKYIDNIVYKSIEHLDSTSRTKENKQKYSFEIIKIFDDLEKFLKIYCNNNIIWNYFFIFKLITSAVQANGIPDEYLPIYYEYLHRDFQREYINNDLFQYLNINLINFYEFILNLNYII